jgi:hypothetical protein
MTDHNNNTPIRLHNPKSHAPAVYIPSWLIQIPNHELSYMAKMVYGRLAQWANHSGKAHRSARQISEEIGMPYRTVQNAISELKLIGLLGTFQAVDGGHNHFEFYDHDLMYRQINKNLCYQEKSEPPYTQQVHPCTQQVHPCTQQVQHKIKEIKEIKEINNIPDSENQGKNKIIKDYQKDERFMRFYNAYPKKEDPRDAWKAFKSIIGDDDILLEEIIADIELRKSKHSKWQDKQYIKYPAVYLRKGEYLGEIYNEAQENEEKAALKKEENEKRLADQEELSRKNAEYERTKQENYIKDGKAYRDASRKAGERPDGLKNLRKQMGM